MFNPRDPHWTRLHSHLAENIQWRAGAQAALIHPEMNGETVTIVMTGTLWRRCPLWLNPFLKAENDDLGLFLL